MAQCTDQRFPIGNRQRPEPVRNKIGHFISGNPFRQVFKRFINQSEQFIFVHIDTLPFLETGLSDSESPDSSSSFHAAGARGFGVSSAAASAGFLLTYRRSIFRTFSQFACRLGLPSSLFSITASSCSMVVTARSIAASISCVVVT